MSTALGFFENLPTAENAVMSPSRVARITSAMFTVPLLIAVHGSCYWFVPFGEEGYPST
jgi:hypothetical protein